MLVTKSKASKKLKLDKEKSESTGNTLTRAIRVRKNKPMLLVCTEMIASITTWVKNLMW